VLIVRWLFCVCAVEGRQGGQQSRLSGPARPCSGRHSQGRTWRSAALHTTSSPCLWYISETFA
jgi:hypothetical protein